MVDKRRNATIKSKAKLPEPKQRTLLDLFQPKSDKLQSAPGELAPAENELPATPDLPPPKADGTEDTLTTAVVERLRQASLEPRPVHPFFVKPVPSQSSDPAVTDFKTPKATVIEILDDETIVGASPQEFQESLSSSQEEGSQHDPIILDSSPIPIRPFKSGVAKPLAPLFAPRRPKDLTSSQTPQASKAIKYVDAVYPDKDSQHIRGPQHAFSSPILPYPRRSLSGATRSMKTLNDTSNLLAWISTNNTNHPESSLQHLAATTTIPSYTTTISDEHRQHPAITRLDTQPEAPSPVCRLWADKWRPTRAIEVLGNEQNAIYLRDWIRALELHLETDGTTRQDDDRKERGKGKGTKANVRGTKRPRVVRSVEKRRGKKKRRNEDDFIVIDEEEESEDDTIDYDDLDRYYSEVEPPSSPVHHDETGTHTPSAQTSAVEPELFASQHSFGQLTNTILLAGPSGTGKTAAVYACAEELGWDVFEVYPGIGKRNGPGIDSLIGDAGKNHHVRKTRAVNSGGSPARGRGALQLFMTKKENGRTTIEDEDDIIPSSEDFGFISPSPAGNLETVPGVRQSLILLEEVDILFKEDAGFWSAVTSFIKDCKRPVICTCNDVSLVPTLDLPLQTILFFQPCPPPLVVSYLHAACSAEGQVLARDSVLQLYKNSASELGVIDVPDTPTPSTSVHFPEPDLRQTINHLQFLCTSAYSKNEGTSQWERGLVEDLCHWDWAEYTSADHNPFSTLMRTEAPPGHLLATRHADLVSFTDSYLVRGAWDTPEAFAWSDCEPSTDDEVGPVILFCPRAASSSIGLGLHTRDSEIASAVMWLSRGGGKTREPKTGGISPFRTRELFRARVDHQLEVGKALAGIVPLSILTMRRKEVQLEYATRIRDIVAAEDTAEILEMKKDRMGRTTRNSVGRRFVRTLEITVESRAALAGTVLGQL